MTAKSERLIAPWLKTLKPYVAEQAKGLIKLDAMENPYPFPEALVDAWLACIKASQINRYPDPSARALKDALSTQLDLPQDAALLFGNGSDEIIHLLCLAFNQPGASMMSPVPSFAVYSLAAQAVNMAFLGVPLIADNFALDLESFIAAVAKHQPNLIFLASPNNPTGNRFDDQDIRSICQTAEGLVVLDEAYWRFAGNHSVHRLFDIENIVFMHTLSKIGLAGVRLGALIGRAQWLDPLERVRMPYNVSSLTQATACFAIENDAHFQQQISKICDSRNNLARELATLDYVTVWPSETNFLLIKVDENCGKNATQIHQQLRAAGIVIKNLDGAHPYLHNCLRVSIGTESENQQFLAALQELVRKS